MDPISLVMLITSLVIFGTDIGWQYYVAGRYGPKRAAHLVARQWDGPLGAKVRADFSTDVINKMKAEQKEGSALEKKFDELVKQIAPAKADDVRAMMQHEMRRARKQMMVMFEGQVDKITNDIISSSKGKINRLIQDEIEASIEEEKKQMKEMGDAAMMDLHGSTPGETLRLLGYKSMADKVDAGNAVLSTHPELLQRFIPGYTGGGARAETVPQGTPQPKINYG